MIEFNENGLGISILFKNPVVLGTPRVTERVQLESISDYTHKISAIGGYESADIGIVVPSISVAELWFSQALGWHVEVYGRSAVKIWEGFINTVTINGGRFSATHGPLLDAINRVSVMYTPIIGYNEDTGEPITGTQTETTIVNNTDSQARYGIIERVLSGGQLLDDGTDNNAEYARDTFLEENAFPKSTSSIVFGGGASGGISMTISCRGYFDWLDRYIYNGGSGLSVAIETKIKTVLGADPNSMFSTNYSFIESVGTLVNDLEDKNRTALTIIREALTLGSGADLPLMFGIYNDRVARLNTIPTLVEYSYKIFSDRDTLMAANETPIDSYDIMPGRWAIISDFQVDVREQGLTILQDPRGIFIESIDFSAPDSVTISGSPVVKMPQLLAKLGIGGI